MKTINSTILIIIVLVLTSCGSALKRFKKLEDPDIDNNLVTFSIGTSNVTKPSSNINYKTIFDLQKNGQEAVLTNRSIDDVSKLLNGKYQKISKKKLGTIDLSTKNIRVIFSIDRKIDYGKDNFNAFDRIVLLNYSFALDPVVHSDYEFKKWNKYITEYGTIDIGSLELNQTFSTSLSATGKVGASLSSSNSSTSDDGLSTDSSSTSIGPEASATGSLGYSSALKENQIIRRQYIKFTGKFEERKFEIKHHGTRENDLVGNVSVDLTIQLPSKELFISSFANLFNGNNQPINPDKVKFEIARYAVPDSDKITTDLIGTLKHDFVVRHINKGINTYAELDDKICYISGNNQQNVNLAKIKDLVTPVFYIQIDISGKKYTFKLANGKTLHFLTLDETLKFKDWLIQFIGSGNNTAGKKIAGYTFDFDGYGLNNNIIKNNLNKIEIVRTND